MSRPNTTLWGSLLPGGVAGETADGGIDTTQVVDNALWTLHAGSRADLVWWTEGDLIQWMDEALKRLSRIACVFVGRAADTLTVAGQAAYALPDRHVSTLHVSHLTTGMRPASTLELESRDPAYQTAPGTPDHWYEDLQGGMVFSVAPVPDTSDEPLPVIYNGFPDTLDAGKQNTLVAAPAPLRGYLGLAVIKSCYEREGELESPDIAQHCSARMQLYEQAMVAIYGKGI